MTGDIMDCIYLNRDNKGIGYCHAQPMRKGETLSFYKPTEDEVKNICTNPKSSCPRYEAYQYHLEIQSKGHSK